MRQDIYLKRAVDPSVRVSAHTDGADRWGTLKLGDLDNQITIYATEAQLRSIADTIFNEFREPEVTCDFAQCDEPVKNKVTFTADDGETTTDYLFCGPHSSLSTLLTYETTLPARIQLTPVA